MFNGYFIFHLNLAFSSIPVNRRAEVIEKCYWPLLHLIRNKKILAGIEVTGYTLVEIERIDKSWVSQFKSMIESEECALIGSGWSQMIGPLAPEKVNVVNQNIGLRAYDDLLNVRPKVALLNEMAYSSGMVDLYANAGYEAIIIDRKNITINGKERLSGGNNVTHAKGLNKELAIIWADAIIFQRLQRYIHGDISIQDYLTAIGRELDKGDINIPIYSNDAEIFNFRPGRYKTESIKLDDEWQRFSELCDFIQAEFDMQWISPNRLADNINSSQIKLTSTLTSIANPINVKKQEKYNICRWALSGRDDLWLNTQCYQLADKFASLNNSNLTEWKKLCELWGSDLRTHITEAKWKDALKELGYLQTKFANSIADEVNLTHQLRNNFLDYDINNIVRKSSDGLSLHIETCVVKASFSLRRGLALTSLAFESQNFEPILGTLDQGYFDEINLGVDFYSGGVFIESHVDLKRFTDLEWVDVDNNIIGDTLILKVKISMMGGYLVKTIKIALLAESLSFKYEFIDIKRPLGIVRAGIFTLIPEGWSGQVVAKTNQGGGDEEFYINENCNHGKSVSTLVSAINAISNTEGNLRLYDSRGLRLRILSSPKNCASMLMFVHQKTSKDNLTRFMYSLSEVDDTSKCGGQLMPLELTINSPKINE